MNAVVQAQAESRHLLSGNEAVARAAWEAGVRVAAAYPDAGYAEAGAQLVGPGHARHRMLPRRAPLLVSLRMPKVCG